MFLKCDMREKISGATFRFRTMACMLRDTGQLTNSAACGAPFSTTT